MKPARRPRSDGLSTARNFVGRRFGVNTVVSRGKSKTGNHFWIPRRVANGTGKVSIKTALSCRMISKCLRNLCSIRRHEAGFRSAADSGKQCSLRKTGGGGTVAKVLLWCCFPSAVAFRFDDRWNSRSEKRISLRKCCKNFLDANFASKIIRLTFNG